MFYVVKKLNDTVLACDRMTDEGCGLHEMGTWDKMCWVQDGIK